MATTQTTSALWASTSTTSLKATTTAMYNRSLLSRAYPALLHAKFGQRRPLKQRNGTTMIFRRYNTLTSTTTPLTEGVTPTGTSLDYTNVEATIKQYGNFVVISDLLDMTHFDPIINEASELMGENMGDSLDLVYREILNAGTNALFIAVDGSGTEAFGAARVNVNGVLTKEGLDSAINLLDRANAKKYTTLIQGADKDNTYPVAPSYWGLIHPDMERDLYASAYSNLTKGTDFVPVEQYSMQTQVMPTEVGKYRSVRFLTTTNAKIWSAVGGTTDDGVVYRGTAGTGCDVYSCLIFARDAYGLIPLSGGSARTIIHRAGGNQDPLNQRNTVGWKAATTGCILQQNNMVRIECASLI